MQLKCLILNPMANILSAGKMSYFESLGRFKRIKRYNFRSYLPGGKSWIINDSLTSEEYKLKTICRKLECRVSNDHFS